LNISYDKGFLPLSALTTGNENDQVEPPSPPVAFVVIIAIHSNVALWVFFYAVPAGNTTRKVLLIINLRK